MIERAKCVETLGKIKEKHREESQGHEDDQENHKLTRYNCFARAAHEHDNITAENPLEGLLEVVRISAVPMSAAEIGSKVA